MSPEPPVERRRPRVTVAVSSADLSGLELATLREYRQALSDEEDRVSYWRRLLHGRIDLLKAQAASGGTLSVSDLVRVLGDTGTGRSRRTLMRVPAPVALPDLPDLDNLIRLWTAHPEDADDVTRLIERLHAQASELSDYRSALHDRIDEATGELIMRYRAHPRAALALLRPRDDGGGLPSASRIREKAMRWSGGSYCRRRGQLRRLAPLEDQVSGRSASIEGTPCRVAPVRSSLGPGSRGGRPECAHSSVAGSLSTAPPAGAAAAPSGASFVNLGTAASYSVLAGAGVTSTGAATVLAGDLA